MFSAILFAGCPLKTDDSGVPSQPPLREVFSFSGKSDPILFAHRGGPGAGYPENAIETFERTYQKTGAFMEVDPRYTKDGVIVLFHDGTLDRCSTGTGKVSDHTLAELKRLNLLDNNGEKTPYTLPTLEEALEWARGKSVLLLDRKDVSVEDRVKAIQRNEAYSCAMVSAYSYEEAKRIYQLDPRVMMQVFMPDLSAFDRFEATGVPWENVIASVSKVPITQAHRELIGKIHDKGAMVVVASYRMIDHPFIAGEISQETFRQQYEALIGAGVDIIQCDLPIQVNEALTGKGF